MTARTMRAVLLASATAATLAACVPAEHVPTRRRVSVDCAHGAERQEYLRFLARRGDFGAGVETAQQIAQLVASTGQPNGYERTRPDGRVIEIRRNPVPDGGFVLIFSDITDRKRSEAEIRAARDTAEAAFVI